MEKTKATAKKVRPTKREMEDEKWKMYKKRGQLAELRWGRKYLEKDSDYAKENLKDRIALRKEIKAYDKKVKRRETNKNTIEKREGWRKNIWESNYVRGEFDYRSYYDNKGEIKIQQITLDFTADFDGLYSYFEKVYEKITEAFTNLGCPAGIVPQFTVLFDKENKQEETITLKYFCTLERITIHTAEDIYFGDPEIKGKRKKRGINFILTGSIYDLVG